MFKEQLCAFALFFNVCQKHNSVVMIKVLFSNKTAAKIFSLSINLLIKSLLQESAYSDYLFSQAIGHQKCNTVHLIISKTINRD